MPYEFFFNSLGLVNESNSIKHFNVETVLFLEKKGNLISLAQE